jgi:hypothetical protein
MTIRRVAMVATGLAMAGSFGLGGAATSGATGLKITPGSHWTSETKNHGCEIETFKANGTFKSDDGNTGTWSGGGKTVTMTWTSGPPNGLVFNGTFTKSPTKRYVGTFDTYKSQLVPGAQRTYQGSTCA